MLSIDTDMKRRTLLEGIAGSAFAGALAGCISVPGILNNTTTTRGTREESAWSLDTILTVPDRVGSVPFHARLAIENATTALVAASHPADGAAYIFRKSQQKWSHQATLRPDFGDRYFGPDVALDGETALIGATIEAYEPDDPVGKVYVFQREDGNWQQRATLEPAVDDFDRKSTFGTSVAVDGTTALVGDRDGGSVYVFSQGADEWRQQAKLTSFATDGPPPDEPTALALEGDVALIGTPQVKEKGAVHVFEQAEGTWTKTATLTGPPSEKYGDFGVEIALDGDTALIGAAEERSKADGPGKPENGGEVYLFKRSAGGWSHQTTFRAPKGEDGTVNENPDLSPAGALSEGTALVVTNQHQTDDRGDSSGGGIFAFERSRDRWRGAGRIAPEPIYGEGSIFEHNAVLDGTTALVSLREQKEDPGKEEWNGEVAVLAKT